MMAAHLEMCHLGIGHHSFFSQPHSQLPTLVPTICTKNTSLTLPSPIFAQKNFTHSFWLHLMMAAILNSAILDSATAILNSETLLFSLRVTQKHSHSTLTLTQTNSICLKLIHSHLIWWWQPSWIVPSWIQPFCTKRTSPIHSHTTWWWQPSWICHPGFSHFAQKNFTIHSHSTWWWQPSWIAIGFRLILIKKTCYLLSDSLKNTLTLLWLWLKHSIWL